MCKLESELKSIYAEAELQTVMITRLGQPEINIDDTVDMAMLLVPPAGEDEMQGTKKGIMEIADVVVVHKAGGDLADQAHARGDVDPTTQPSDPAACG